MEYLGHVFIISLNAENRRLILVYIKNYFRQAIFRKYILM